ncbi:MAG: DUF455 family protein [Propionivibrio sp.]|nr:DUF455 family protein [Propionivibrio sp.]
MSSSITWTVREASLALNEITYLERAVAHVLAGWLPKLPEMTVKLALGQQQYEMLDRATQLRSRLSGLLRAEGIELPIKCGWRELVKHLDASPDPGALFAGLYGFLWPRLLELVQRYLASADPVGDQPSLRLVTGLASEVETQLSWGQSALRATPSREKSYAFLEQLEALWTARDSGADLAPADWLWSPLDRVPLAARPAGLEHCKRGSLGLLAVDSIREARDVGIFLHSDLDEEFTTLELMGRNSYEHPDMPWQFHLDMARQVADEARHAQLMLQLLEARGFGYGDFPISTGTYDGLYQFEPCPPGSRKELLWRMLIRQTFMEGLALDSLARDIRRRTEAGHHDIARALDYILRDEVFHAGSGLRWSAYLLDGDRRAVLQERYESLTFYTTKAEAWRASFVETHVEEAMAELMMIEEGKRRRGGKLPDRPLNRLGRQQAGFNDDDILQVLSWGYASEP